MVLYINYDINKICKNLLQQQLDILEVKYTLLSLGEVELKEPLSDEKLQQLTNNLNANNIEIVESQKSILVQRIKDTIVEMVFTDEKNPMKFSAYLADKLSYNYNYLANLFSSETYTSIEKFILLQKTERAKQLLAMNELNITEIAWKLNYSSTAHFSNQFKSITGITPTVFQRIILKKREVNNE